ncbi:phage tail spike protein [Bacillus sp. AFS029637]|nr:phage tail spike protein [Bacillus sp. AFS029637]PGZ69591.1 peptidase S74 [Bacillus sp. AFS029637]
MRKPSGNLHVVDFKTSQIVSAIQPKDYWDDKRHWEIKNNIDTLEFKVFEDTDHAATLMQQNLVLKEVRGGRIVPYVITEVEKNSDDSSLTVYASGEWIQLAKAGIIEPQNIESKTLQQFMEIALKGTKWEIGKTEHDGAHSMVIEEFTDPLDLLKKIAASFELEIQYRAEVVGSQIVVRYVDMVKKRGRDTRKEVTVGKDLLGIKRIENSQNICTALLGYVKKEDGEFVTISEINNGVPYLVDNAAYQRWNEKGKHKFAFYTPQTENEDMSPQRLLTLMKTEMNKLVNTSVSYEVHAQSIGQLFGLAHELINEGDTIRIIDTGFTPKLYLEARTISGDESFKDPTQDKYMFGNYREIVDQNDELRRLYQKILSSLYDKVPQELFDQLKDLVNEQNEAIIEAQDKANQAQEESQTAKDLAEATVDYMQQNLVDIIESINPPTTELKPNKTLWHDISNGRPGILKIWTGTTWEPVVPDVEGIKRDLELTNESVKSKISEKQLEDYVGGLGTTNVLFNTAFEDRVVDSATGIVTSTNPSITKWETRGTGIGATITATSSRNRDGYNSVQINNTDQTDAKFTSINQSVPIAADSGAYVFSVWAFTHSLSEIDEDGAIELTFRNGSTQVANKITYLKANLKEGVWTQLFIRLDAPASAVNLANVRMYIRKNGNVWFAQPMLQQGTSPSSFMEHPKDYANYDQLVDEIAKKVATSEYNNKISTIESEIKQQSDRIDLTVSEEDVYTKNQSDGRYGEKAIVERHESSISLLTDEIKLSVKEGDIASTINQTAQSVLIQADKIYLNGYIEAKHLKAQMLQGITIQTAPQGSGANQIRLNAQNMTLYGSGRNRGYFGFMDNTQNLIKTAIVLGNDYTSNTQIEGSMVLEQITPTNNNYTVSTGSIGIASSRAFNGDIIKTSYIDFARRGDMNIRSTYGMNIITQNSTLTLQTNSNDGISIDSGSYMDFTSSNATYTFKNSRNAVGKWSMRLYESNINNGDVDLNVGNQLTLRVARQYPYTQEGLQVKNNAGNDWAGVSCGVLTYSSLSQRSTRALKTAIKDIEALNVLDTLMELQPRQYFMKADVNKLYEQRAGRAEGETVPTYNDISQQYGFIAEEVPEAFATPGRKAVNMYPLITLGIAGTQEVYKKHLSLEETVKIQAMKLEVLEVTIQKQEDKIARLEELLFQ